MQWVSQLELVNYLVVIIIMPVVEAVAVEVTPILRFLALAVLVVEAQALLISLMVLMELLTQVVALVHLGTVQAVAVAQVL
jgi:hypothetical protein